MTMMFQNLNVILTCPLLYSILNIDQWNKMLGSYLMPKKSLLRVYIYGIINTHSASAICMENTQYVRDWKLSAYIHSHFDEEIIQSEDISVIRSYKIDILIHRPSVRRKLWYSSFWSWKVRKTVLSHLLVWYIIDFFPFIHSLHF